MGKFVNGSIQFLNALKLYSTFKCFQIVLYIHVIQFIHLKPPYLNKYEFIRIVNQETTWYKLTSLEQLL